MDIQAMPTRSCSVWHLREYTCPVCRAAYGKRNSLNRHSKAKHVPKLKCFFCEMFPADRNTRRSLHMLKTYNYPVPETYLQGPLNSHLDFNLMGNSIRVLPNNEYVAPVLALVPSEGGRERLFGHSNRSPAQL